MLVSVRLIFARKSSDQVGERRAFGDIAYTVPTGPDVLPSLDSVEFASQIELLMIAAADEARSLQAETEHIGRDARDLGGQDDVVSATLDKDFTIRVRRGTLGRGNEARSSGNTAFAAYAPRRPST